MLRGAELCTAKGATGMGVLHWWDSVLSEAVAEMSAPKQVCPAHVLTPLVPSCITTKLAWQQG